MHMCWQLCTHGIYSIHTRTRAGKHTCLCAYIHISPCTRIRRCTHEFMHMHIPAQMYNCAHTRTQLHACTLTPANGCESTHAHMRMVQTVHMRKYKRIHMHAFTRVTHVHPRTWVHAHTHVCSILHMHTCTYIVNKIWNAFTITFMLVKPSQRIIHTELLRYV